MERSIQTVQKQRALEVQLGCAGQPRSTSGWPTGDPAIMPNVGYYLGTCNFPVNTRQFKAKISPRLVFPKRSLWLAISKAIFLLLLAGASRLIFIILLNGPSAPMASSNSVPNVISTAPGGALPQDFPTTASAPSTASCYPSTASSSPP